MTFRIIGILILALQPLMVVTEGFAIPYPYEILDSSSQSQIRSKSHQDTKSQGLLIALKSTGVKVPLMNRAFPQNNRANDPEKKSGSGFILRKVKEWRETVVDHNPGEPDSAAVEIGRWNSDDLETVIDFITKLASRSKKSIRRTIAKAPIRSRLKLTNQEVQKGDLNRILKQGALLHTDIALLDLERGRYVNKSERTGAFIDGRVVFLNRKVHLKLARSLINAISPSPSEDPMARQWYIATTAHMQNLRQLAYAQYNIESALKIFPSDTRILLYAGVLHETLASPVNQNIQLPPRGEVSYGSKKDELKQAQKLFRRVIKINPDSAEAYLRLGRVLGLLGLPHQAIVELKHADALIKDPQLSYYVSLFLGYEFETISHQHDARNFYERAARLYPKAQSPQFALSQLARNNDDTEEAILAIQRVFALPFENSINDDPLWIYDLSHVRDAHSLVEKMRRIFGDFPQ